MELLSKILIIIISATPILKAINLPTDWPWVGVTTAASAIVNDPESIDFIIDQNIKNVRININISVTMKKNNVNAQKALDLNLKWTKTISEKLYKSGINSHLAITNFPKNNTLCKDNTHESYWSNDICIEQIYDVVKQCVEYFRDSKVLSYQFFGEPDVKKNGKVTQPSEWYNIFNNIINITSSIDSSKYLIFSPGPNGNPKNYSNLVPFEYDKIIYNAHMYVPFQYTHQGIKRNQNQHNIHYPGFINSKYWWEKTLREFLQPLFDFQLQNDIPVVISEFSVVRWAPDKEIYLNDLINIFNEYDWSWMYLGIGNRWYGWDARYDIILNEDFTKPVPYKIDSTSTFKLLKQNF